LCFIGRKQRQFLSIDVNELNACLINNDYKMNGGGGGMKRSEIGEDDELYGGGDEDEDDYEDEAKSIVVSLENIHNIERCHLFECKLIKSTGYWYLAVATPETIFILLFNKITNKYTLVRAIQTASDAPCICVKFTNAPTINQLIYACGKDFSRMDLTYLQSAPILLEQQQGQLAPISVCVISSASASASASYYSGSHHQQEAILLCYSTYGIFLVYNFATAQWQLPVTSSSSSASKNKSSSSSIASSIASGSLAVNGSSSSSSNLLKMSSILKWPRGSGLTPLQIEYDASYLYLFYNDSIIVYNVSFESDMSLSVRKCGITFIYKPRYLSTFNNKTSNCLIISNRRLPDETTYEQSSDNSQESNGGGGSNDGEDDDDEIKKSNDPVLNGLNDKTCLSYFTPGSN
jgi:hypothetical protein